ncbi:MAG: Hercynine oxygenase [bacterium]|nr:Hercynine oxygenase [bacterium]
MIPTDPFSANFLSSLAANVATQLIDAAIKRLGSAFLPSAKQAALKRCLHSGIVAIAAAASKAEKDNAGHLAEIFEKFFQEPDVGKQLVRLLRSQPLDRTELAFLFQNSGYDADTLPHLNFDQCLNAFEAAFLTAALDEPELREVIQAAEMLKQTHLQQELLAAVRGLIAFLKQAHLESLHIQAGLLTALAAGDGKQVVYQLPTLVSGPPPMDWESHYLRTLASQCEGIDLTPIDETVIAGPAADAISVSAVFTTLYLANLRRRPEQPVAEAILRRGGSEELVGRGRAGSRKPKRSSDAEQAEKEIPISAVETVAALPRLVILGQPGGGKSTLVNHIAAQLAYRCLGKDASADKLTGWAKQEKPLPVRIVLRRFAAWLPPGETRPGAGLVWDYLKHQLHECGCEDAFAGVQQQLREQGGVVFFDGLDEVPAGDEDTKRTLITHSIHEFAKPLDQCRVVITCREYAYRRGTEPWHLPEASFPVVELDLFKQEQIESFIKTWYQVVGPPKGWGKEKCAGEADNLILAVQNWEHLRELAQYPLLLTLMAQVHGRDGYLPKDRADLYDRAVNLLLAHWENRIVRDMRGSLKVEPGLVMQLGIRTETLRHALERVAFTAHERQEKEARRSERAADIPHEELREELGKTLNSLDKAETVIAYIQERAGLLQARDNRIYTFPHRTFQEYLAARYLMRQAEFDTMLRERVRRDLDWWREVYLLAAGSARTTPRNICELVEALVPNNPEPEKLKRANLDHILLASQALHETEFVRNVAKSRPEEEPDRFSRVFTRHQNWLQQLLEADQQIAAQDRARAGNMLALLTDPREAVTTLDHMEFCLVPAGDFWMEHKDEGEEAAPHVNKQLSYDYWISRFPITVAQYQLFVNATEHKLENPDCLKDPANRPVRFMTWYEVMTFCDWLTQHWRKQGLLPKQWRVQLPSEAEWEKAARGGLKVPKSALVRSIRELTAAQPNFTDNEKPQRRFPWGENEDTNLANYDATKINDTSAVGCFPGGKSPYGCQEMAGNVWEWTRSLWGKDWDKPVFKYPYDPADGRENINAPSDILRVLRGGAFNLNQWCVRCAYRLRIDPDDRDDYIGFRVVVSPSL